MAKILLIDDRPVNRLFLTTLLGYQHHQLSEASDGAEGLRMAREQRPDLIISDVLMPTMDGYEFVLQLRADPEIGKTPVVFSTAHYLGRESKALAKKCGITSIIFKPCEPQAVLDIVAAALGEQPVPLPPALRQPEEFNRDHLLLVTNKVAESADELRAAHDKLSALIELSTDLAQERDPVLLLDRICSVAREVIGTRWTMVVLLEPNRKTVQHLGVAGIHLEDSPALRSALLENGVFKTVTQEGRTISLSDVTSTPTALRLPKGLPRAASLLVAPLVMRAHVDGWICLADKLGLDAFTEEDEQLAPALAAQMAVAYANARLYSDSLKYASKLESEISERTRAEQQLSESKARLTGIIDSAMDAIITIDSGQKIVMFNKAAEKMFSCLAAKVIGQPLDRFIPPRFTVSHAQDIRRFGETGVTTRAMGKTPAVNAVRADGAEFPVEASISQIEVGDQKLYTVIMRDISERKLAEEAGLLLAAIVQSSEDAIIGKTLDGIITSWNKGAERHYGYSAGEVVGRSIAILAPSDHSDELTSILERLRRVESIEQFETERITKEGTRVLVSLTISPIKNSSGQVVGASTIARDITERKQAEKALKETNQHLKQALEALQEKTNELTATTQQLWQASKLATMGELAASVAHELNNPLATVGLRAENLLMQLPEHSDQRKPLEIIAQEVDRMATLVNNLLQFSRRSHRQVSTLDPSEEIATSVEFVHYHLRSHNIEVVREFADGLPSIQADREQLRQLFLNLLTNASDSMPQGGILTVRATSNGFGDSAVAIDFADTGEGITAENMEKIWEPFFTTKPEGKGTGLGLAICCRIVEEHGGTIDIQSPVGRGTTVHIVLPATSTEALV